MSDLDCTKCGACCIEAGHVRVRDEEAYVPRKFVERVDPYYVGRCEGFTHDTCVLKKYLGGRCKALDGVVGVSCSCTIYYRRPAVCREFLPGTPGCTEARARAERKIANPAMKPRGYGEDWKSTV